VQNVADVRTKSFGLRREDLVECQWAVLWRVDMDIDAIENTLLRYRRKLVRPFHRCTMKSSMSGEVLQLFVL
jgi:hypothetical protein